MSPTGGTRRNRGRRRAARGGEAPDTPAVRDPWQDAAPPAARTAAALAAELAGLSPAERYERLIDFPTDHPFKVIGAAEQSFADGLRAALDGLGHPGAELRPRYSSGANYVAFTVTLRVANGAAMVRVYEVLGALPGLKYLL